MDARQGQEPHAAAVHAVRLGDGPSALIVGGETAMPCMYSGGQLPNRQVVGLEITDVPLEDSAEALNGAFGSSRMDAARWARDCVERHRAEIVCLHLVSAHPDAGGRAYGDIVKTVKAVASAVNVPLVILGCGDDGRDAELMPLVSQALKGRNALLGVATQSSYRTLAATCLADGHAIIAESPIDVNIAKQVNILISEMGLPQDRIVMHPTTTALGYGMEYVYSINERARLAAFVGDTALAMPFIVFTGAEVWKIKEAKTSEAQGVAWEVSTAAAMIQSGVDIVIMGHPRAAASVMAYRDSVTAQKGR